MKIGYIQFAPALCNLDATLSRLDPLLSSCDQADLVVLPELCNSGYNFRSREEAHSSAESLRDSKFLSFLTEQCRRHSYDIVTGLNERDGHDLYNSAVLVGPEGYIGHYRKMHLFLREKEYFSPGNTGLPIFRRGQVTLGLLVCFDWMFVEVWRILALKGADIICHPSNLVLPGLAQHAIPVYALINRVFIVTANRIGTEGNLTFTGQSLIVNPQGEILSRAPETDAQVDVVSIEVDMARDKVITPMNNLFNDRRPDDYGDLVSRLRPSRST